MEAFQLLRCVELLRACLLYKFLGEDLAKFNMWAPTHTLRPRFYIPQLLVLKFKANDACLKI